MVLGMMTLLKQFNPENRNQFIAILAQYIRSSIRLSDVQRPTELPVELAKVLSFLEDFIEFSEIKRTVLETYVPKYVLDHMSMSN